MAQDSRNAVQTERKRRVQLLFLKLRRAARAAPTEEATPETEQLQQQIWELHHAITLNEGW